MQTGRVMPLHQTRKGRRRVHTILILAMGLGGFSVAAQQTKAPSLKSADVLRVTTRLVLVDVVVTDKHGKPVGGLTREDFNLWENGKPQRLAIFSVEQPTQPAQAAEFKPPALPPHVSTNRPEYRQPPGPLTLLLLDGLNTPLRDQAYARQELLRYLTTQLRPGQRIAVLALTNRLLLLQDFTSDPHLLLAALEKYHPQQTEPRSRAQSLDRVIDPLYLSASPEILANIHRFEAEQAAGAMDTRVKITLAALRSIARATRSHPGRKNLIWVSGAFPIVFAPGRTSDFELTRSYAAEMRRTTNLLADARVAVYPVDARGLVGALMGDASNPLRNPLGQTRSRREVIEALTRHSTEIESPQQAMEQVATDTGGRAYYNRNDIDAAVALSVEDASIYYTLGYYPEDKDWNGNFRRIKVKVARKGLRLRHRRGYYALDPSAPAEEPRTRQQELLAALGDPLPATGVTFWAQAIPSARAHSAQVRVQFLVDFPAIAFVEDEESRQHCDVDFLAAALSSEGRVITFAHQTLNTGLPLEAYAQVQERGLPFQMQLELAPGQYQLRLAVRDNRTGLLGTTVIPLVRVKTEPAAEGKPK